MTLLEELPPQKVGERLRQAREAAKVTQATAAEAIGVARTTLIAVEQGQRKVRLHEIQKLAQIYDSSVNALLRREAVHVDLVPRFRRMIGDNVEADRASNLMAALATAEVELENLLGVRRVQNYPPERPLQKGDVRLQAEQDATNFRHWLGLGMSPIPNLVGVLEMELGARVYIRRLHSSISGLFAFDSSIGACILLNANHPLTRRNQSAGHELAHLIATRHRPEVLQTSGSESSREERYANVFARALLTPARTVMMKFADITSGSETLTRKHVIVLAHYFGVAREAMVRRLEELGLTKQGTWDWFCANGGITNEQARLVLGDHVREDAAGSEANRPTTLRLSLLASEASRRGLLSEGQLARLLRLDRLELRALLEAYNGDESEIDDGFA